MFDIIETGMNGRRTLIDSADTFDGAVSKVEAMGVILLEGDGDYIDCADAYTSDGRVIAIQPRGFKIGK